KIAVDQLLMMVCLMGHYRKTLNAIFAEEKVELDVLETLVKRLQGSLKYNESSHFSLLLPNTYKTWSKSKSEKEAGECYVLSRRDMAKGGGWCPHGGMHNDGILSPLSLERCKEAFKRAGITPARIDRALEMKLNQELRQSESRQ